VSAYLTGGLALLVAILPTLFLDFKGPNHSAFVQNLGQQIQDNSFAQAIGNALVKDRIDLARIDAIRTLIFIGLAIGLIWLFIKNRLKATSFIVVLGVLILIDMWSVDRRYLNKDNFVEPTV